ncbi:MAG: hypothetical protein M1338_00355 [Patescibacteria group bacterium]|nr:hypothetical protein [Patescibacteria group bacterium]
MYYFKNNAIFAETNVEGDVYSGKTSSPNETAVNNLNIIGTNAVISSTGNISVSQSGAPSILKGYKSTSLNTDQKKSINEAMERLKRDRCIEMTPILPYDFTNSQNPEGMVICYVPKSENFVIDNNSNPVTFKGKATIIVDGDIIIKSNLEPADGNKSYVLGLIANNGNIIIQNNVTTITGVAFYAGKTNSADNSKGNICIKGASDDICP